MVTRAIQFILLAVWLLAWWCVAKWFFMAGYLGYKHVAFFIVGLGLGLLARRLLADDPLASSSFPG